MMLRGTGGWLLGLVWACTWLAVAVPAWAQKEDLSDKSVATLMRYAWAITPGKFTAPSGKVIEVDKAKFKEVRIPIETAREVIRVGRLSAHAQLCDLAEEQMANHRTLMRREEAKGTWTDQQLLYINQLHLFTVITLTGQVKIAEMQEGDKQVEAKEAAPAAKKGAAASCTEADRRRVGEQILAYVKSEPPAPAAGTGPATPQKKK